MHHAKRPGGLAHQLAVAKDFALGELQVAPGLHDRPHSYQLVSPGRPEEGSLQLGRQHVAVARGHRVCGKTGHGIGKGGQDSAVDNPAVLQPRCIAAARA